MLSKNIFSKSISPCTQAIQLGKNISRQFSSYSQNSPSNSYLISHYLKQLHSDILQGRANHSALFTFMYQNPLTSVGWTIFSSNYLAYALNTLTTPASAYLVTQDRDLKANFAKKIFNEEGKGNPEKSHRVLMIRCFSSFAKKFNIPSCDYEHIEQSPHITKETRNFLVIQKQLYTQSEISALAASFTQETLAGPMFVNIFRVFSQYGGHFSDAEWEQDIYPYFRAHILGVEKEHSQMSQNVLTKILTTPEDYSQVTSFSDTFQTIQKLLWTALHFKIAEANKVELEKDPSSIIPFSPRPITEPLIL